jgi:HTH-type transcriptional regulator/antitoxin HigA
MQNITNKTGNKIPGTPKTYLELITAFPPRKINSLEELAATQNVIDSLLDKKNLTTDERDYLHLLGLLVSEYEDDYYPIADIHGVKLLKVLIEESNVDPKDLLLIFKSEETLTDVLNEKQPMTVDQIQKVADLFHISPDIF